MKTTSLVLLIACLTLTLTFIGVQASRHHVPSSSSSSSKCILNCADRHRKNPSATAMYKCAQSCVPRIRLLSDDAANVEETEEQEAIVHKYLIREIQPLILALEQEEQQLLSLSDSEFNLFKLPIVNQIKTKLKSCLSHVFERLKNAKCLVLGKQKKHCAAGQVSVQVDKTFKIHSRYPEFTCKVWECQKEQTGGGDDDGEEPPVCDPAAEVCNCGAGYTEEIVTGSDGCKKCQCQKIPCPADACASKTCPVNHVPKTVPATSEDSCSTCECEKQCPTSPCEGKTCPVNHVPFPVPATSEDSCDTCDCKLSCPTDIVCDASTTTCPAHQEPFVVPAANGDSCPSCGCKDKEKPQCPVSACESMTCPVNQEPVEVDAEDEYTCPTCECQLSCPVSPCASTTCQRGYTPKVVPAPDATSCATCTCEKVVCPIRDCYQQCAGSPFDSYYDANGCLACNCYGALNDAHFGKKWGSKKRRVAHNHRRRRRGY